MTKINFIQSNHAEASAPGTTIAVTLTGVTLGNALVGTETHDTSAGALTGIADQTPTTANDDADHTDTSFGQALRIWSIGNSPSGSRTVTASYSGAGASSRGIQAYEFSGLPQVIVLAAPGVGNDSGAGTATAFDSTISVTPNVDGALLFAIGENSVQQPAADVGWTQGTQDTVNGETVEYQILGGGAGVSVSPAFTTSPADRWSVLIVAYAPGPVASPLLHPLLLGRGHKFPFTRVPPASVAVSGALFNQALPVSSTFTPALTTLSLYQRVLAVSSTFTPALSLLKSFFRTLAVSSTFTPSLTAVTLHLRTLAVNSTFTPALIRTMFKTLAVSSTFTPSLTAVTEHFVTLAVSSTFVPAIVRLPNKVLAVASTFSPALAREMFKTLAVSSTFTPSMAAGRFFARALAVSSTFTPALVTKKVFGAVLAVTSTFTPSIVQLRSISRLLAVSSAFVAVLVAQFISGAAATLAYWTQRIALSIAGLFGHVTTAAASQSQTSAVALQTSQTAARSVQTSNSAALVYSDKD